ncbi:peptide transporter family 2-like [Tribolium madens]|uniref:peptide transporter family 2-like n=1 Tax=Tribolium madens TaxID=41895 RepID=UPI001CF7267E|nr:peptide transporter family 2-like [Tribolium madens]
MSNTQEKLTYPKQISAILAMSLIKNICLVGLRTALLSYLENVINYSKDEASLMYHSFRSFNYCCPLLGALFADCFIGKFYTIVIFLIIYLIGTTTMTGSAVQYSEDISRHLCLFALGLIAVGRGSIKPCVFAFGGNQFKLPQQYKHLEIFFLLIYAAKDAGGAIGIYEARYLSRIHCLGANSCYSAAFLVSTLCLTLSLIIFVSAKRWYVHVKPQKNNSILWVLCLVNGMKGKIVSKEKLDHWLDYCKKSYGESFVRQTKSTLKVVLIFMVLQCYMATIMVVVTDWKTQARFMRNEQGDTVFQPITMLFLNYMLAIAATPITYLIMWFLRSKFNINVTPLRRVAVGTVFGAISMFVAAVLSLSIEAEVPNLPKNGECHIRFYNPLNCLVKIDAPPFINQVQIDPMGYQFLSVKVEGTKKIQHTISGCDKTISNTTGPFVVKEKISVGYFFTTNGLQGFKEDLEKDYYGDAKIRSLVGNLGKTDEKIKYICDHDHVTEIGPQDYSVYKVTSGVYNIGGIEKAARFFRGGIYRVLLYFDNSKSKKLEVHEVGKPHQLHILWQIPQYMIHAISRVLVIPAVLEFAYTQTPFKSLKCTIIAISLLTSGVGGIIHIIIELIHFKQSHFFFTFGGLTMLFTLIFILLAVRYKYVDQQYGKKEDIITEDTESNDE